MTSNRKKLRAVMRFYLSRLIIFSMALLSNPIARAQETSALKLPEPANVESTRQVRPAGREKMAQQLISSFDAGDVYSTPAGTRRLFRLAGAIAVRFRPGAPKLESLQELTAAGGALEGYMPEPESGKDVTVLSAPPLERHRQRREPAIFHDVLAKARQARNILSANPVFVEPASGLAQIPTDEILICLRPDTDPQNYFGDRGAKVRRVRGTRHQFILTLPAANAEKLLAEVDRHSADPRIAWAEPNFLSQVIKQTSDPLFFNQWHLNNTGRNGAIANSDVNGPEAWSSSTGSSDVVIAILDDGVQLNHPDLSPNIFSNPGELANGADDDANGYTDDLHGWDFYRNDNDPNPEFASDRHGTAAAGVAIAAGNNDAGGAGIAYQSRIMPLKVIGGDEWVTASAMAEALYYAAGRTRDGGTWRGADVISISSSFPQSSLVDDALEWAATNGRGGKGCAIFAAAGDEASRWQPTRVRLPVGALTGPGTFRFGFEYSKDLSLAEGEDLVRIDNVALVGSDGVTQLNSPLGPDGRQDFEGVFPPLGWKVATSRGAPVWNATSAGALSGTRGSASAQAGSLAHNQWTELRTPLMTMTGSELLSFSCYISSEDQYDGLKVYVYDANDNYVTVLEGPLGEPLISGNSAVSTDIQYPASHPKTIAVGASTDCDMRSDYSAYGPDLDFLAPSSGGWDDITTTDLMGVGGYVNGDYTPGFGGTSAACPLAAGIGALVLSVNSELTASEVRTILRNSCDKIGGVTYDGGGWNEYYGYGRVNAQRALQDAYRSTGVPYVNLINPANNAFLFAPTNVVITASAGDPDGTIRKVEFFDGAVKLGEDTTAPYALTWAKPPHGEHTLLARVTDNDGKTNYSAAVTVTVAPGISISDAVITEGNSGTSNVVFSVRLSAKSSKTVSVSFAVGDGTAVPGRDYVAASGILVFAPGITNRTIRVPVIGDRLSESNNTFFVNLANPINAGLARRQGRGIIRNNDAGPALSINDVTVTESDSGTTNAVFTVRLSTRSGKTISVNYSTASGSAQGNLDFVPTSGVVTFPPGVINQSIVIPVLGDTLNENDEGFFVNLSRPVHASIAQSQGLGVIVDDDPAPFLSISDTRVTEGNDGTTDALFAVNLSAASAKMITVNYATAGLRKDIVPTNGVIKFPPGATNRVIRVAIIGDTMSEDDETFLVNLGNAANAVIADGQAIGTIVDNDPYPALTVSNASVTEGNSGATNAIFTVRLSAVSGRIITVDYATANGTAVAGSDYVPTSGTVVFPAGTSNQTIRVAVTGEKLSESNETFFVNLTNPINANIADAQGMATIFGVDPLPALSINNASVTENDDGTTDAVFAVRLSTRSGKTITVNYATANGTALAGSDYVAQNGTLTFPPGVTNLPVTVTINDDGILETNETFTVILTAPVNATIADNRGVGTILDNDFKIMAAQVVGTNVLIRFPTLAGRTSRIEYCEQPLGVSAAWITVPGAANIRGTGEVVTGTHFGGASRANCFYRIHLLP